MLGRVVLLGLVAGATAWGLWLALARGAGSGADRLFNVGLGLTVVGIVWTAFAWWLVVPEVILAVGVIVLVIGSRRRRVAA